MRLTDEQKNLIVKQLQSYATNTVTGWAIVEIAITAMSDTLKILGYDEQDMHTIGVMARGIYKGKE